MNKNQKRGNIIFFVGALVFVVSLATGWLTDVSDILVDSIMGLGLVIEFVGLCFCYKKDKNENVDTEKTGEEKALIKEKELIEVEKTEDVVEVVKEEKKTATKKNSTTKKTTKNNNAKKATAKVENNKEVNSKKTTNTKKNNSNKKNNSSKKNTAKKNTTKKNTTKKGSAKKTTK